MIPDLLLSCIIFIQILLTVFLIYSLFNVKKELTEAKVIYKQLYAKNWELVKELKNVFVKKVGKLESEQPQS